MQQTLALKANRKTILIPFFPLREARADQDHLQEESLSSTNIFYKVTMTAESEAPCCVSICFVAHVKRKDYEADKKGKGNAGINVDHFAPPKKRAKRREE